MEALHPFAEYIRILGRGKKGARSLTEAEAHTAMGMILDGHIEPEQLGAFLMLVRIKEETPEEVAGFVRAVRERIQIPGHLPYVDLDWSSYAGKRRHLPWFILSVLLLVDNGVKVFMHGIKGRKDDRLYAPDVLSAFGLPVSQSLSEAAQNIETSGFAYMNLETLFPRLQQLINLRDLLGLRSPVHTVSRLLNPFNAPYQMQGIFHPGYMEIHQKAAALLGQPHMTVIKGEGGEIEYNPDSPCQLYSVHDGNLYEEEWPAVASQRHKKPETLDVNLLADVWRNKTSDDYGHQTIIATTAVTLYTMRKAENKEEAFKLAESMWDSRTLDLI